MNVFSRLIRRLAFAWLLVLLTLPAHAAPYFDDTPRMAIISAFAPELEVLEAHLQEPRSYWANGVELTTVVLRDQAVVLFLSGISMTNAAMTTQLALDRFAISHIIFSGIAGGVNPGLHIGDVVVAQRWGQYLEVLMAREGDSGEYDTDDPEGLPAIGGRFGMMVTRPVRVRSAQDPEPQQRFWFEVDPEMLDIARQLKGVRLSACLSEDNCL